MWKQLAILSLILAIVLSTIPVQAASVTISPNVILNGPYGRLTVRNNQQYAMFVLYANGTMFFNYTGLEDHVSVFSFTAQSYGNGTFDLRFKGGVPSTVTQSAATSTYVTSNKWQRLTYTASQTSPLIIIFTTNPRFSLQAGAFFGAAILIFVVIVRTLYVATANDSEERRKRIDQNRIIFIVMGLVVASLWIFSLLFP